MKNLVSFPRYERYKASGAEWLGEVPEHWLVVKMKYLYKDVSIKNKPEGELLSVTQDKGVVPRTWVEKRMVMPSGNLESFKFISKGDFAISLRSFEGGLEYCHHDGIISPAYTVLKSKKTNLIKDFYKYLFKSSSFISELQTSIVGIREGKNISYAELCYSLLPVPPVPIQKDIATFLNEKTAQIDQAIDIKKKQIELLKERQQVIIQQAVTKGLDPKVKMRDSGVEWIGEVPEHWEIVRFRNFFKFNRGLNITKENLIDEGIPCVSYGEVHSRFGFEVNPQKHELMCVSNDYLTKNKSSLINKGDIVFADTSEDIEGSGNFTQLVTNDIVFAGYHTIICKPLKSINYRYLAYSLESISYRNQIRKQVKGVKVYSITQSILKNTYIWLPSEREQEEISHYLDQMRSQIKLAIEAEERQIKKLQEYKSSLINSAVTGKIKITPDMIAAEE